MSVSRRKFMQALTVAGGAGVTGSSANLLAEPRPGKHPGRKKRTLYYNDARHYYLYVFEPPMTLEDAWVPIDEVAGTAVDTFVYGVERGDGLFYPSRVGQRFGADMRPFELTAYWRTWENMQSLIDRGLDPLTVLIDRAHQKGMDFFASVRMASYGGLEGKYKVPEGGRGLAHEFVRDHQYAVLKELATEYATEGVELDFAAAPGGMPLYLKPEDVPAMTPVLTEWVAKISEAPSAIGPASRARSEPGSIPPRRCASSRVWTYGPGSGRAWSTTWRPSSISISPWTWTCLSTGSSKRPTPRISPSTAPFSPTSGTKPPVRRRQPPRGSTPLPKTCGRGPPITGGAASTASMPGSCSGRWETPNGAS